MGIEEALRERSESTCELCSAAEGLGVYEVPSSPETGADACVYLCQTCREQIEDPHEVDGHRWRCLGESMWSQTPAVQVMAWRMLKRLSGDAWARDLLDTLYLEDDTQAWAEAAGDDDGGEVAVKHVDSNGSLLADGDSVALIKDLEVKGANFTAKRGTAVRNISLVADNNEHIEGRVSGQQVVILTKFVKKLN